MAVSRNIDYGLALCLEPLSVGSEQVVGKEANEGVVGSDPKITSGNELSDLKNQ